MPIRILCLSLVVALLAIYAWRDWYKSLCGLVVLMAFIEHADMPKKIMDIQGLSPLNIVMFCILVAWATSRYGQNRGWDMPGQINYLLLAYLAVFLTAVFRMIYDREALGQEYTLGDLISERLINTIKWVIPGLLMFDGCRTVKDLKIAVGCICLMYLFLALQVIAYMPIGAVLEPEGLEARMKLADEMGLSPSILGKVFAGGAWVFLAGSSLTERRPLKAAALACFLVTSLALAMVGCRSGYLAWMVVGLTLCGLCWRRRLLAMAIVALVLFLTLQGVSSRLTTGFGETDVAGQKTVNYYEVTSGRNLIWPYVLEKIADAPNFGYGRDAMRRTGLTAALEASVGKSEAVGHAHNAYLELVLESGVVGLAVVMVFYGAVGLRAVRLFRVPNCPACAGAGGVALATIVGYLVTGLGSQHFYPQEGDIGMWCAIGLALRVACDSRHGTVHPPRQRHQTRST